MEAPQCFAEHMLPLVRVEENTGDQSSGVLLQREPDLRTHCHVAPTAEDPVARNQLIAISVLCFIFMVAEVVGEFYLNVI